MSRSRAIYRYYRLISASAFIPKFSIHLFGFVAFVGFFHLRYTHTPRTMALSPANGTGGGPNSLHPPPAPAPDGESWDQHPIYVALSSRLSATENAVASLSAQVSHLQSLVQSVLPAAQAQAHAHGRAQSAPNSIAGDSVSALTQQISALSTSVAQLQRLQQSQTNLSRQHSRSDRGLPGTGAASPAPGPPSLSMPPNANANTNVYNTGPLTAPAPAPAHGSGMFGPGPGVGLGGKPHHPRDFLSRPPASRSVSSSIVPQGVGGDDKTWAPLPPRTPGAGGVLNPLSPGAWPNTASNNNSNNTGGAGAGAVGGGGGGMMTPSVTGPSGAPGAGIVVTKWDHLNLKPELVRSIQKYGIGPPNKIQARVLPFMLKGSDIIAQAPPTQERIISYIIPAIHQASSVPPTNGPYRGPSIIIVTTTVDQATQAHKLVRNVGGPLGVRAVLATGVAGSSGLPNELANMQREAAQILIGTPAKVTEVMTIRGGLQGGEVRTLILDEVDQLIARNLYENVLNLVKVLPSPRRGGGIGTPGGEMAAFSPGVPLSVTSPYDAGRDSPFNPASQTPFPGQSRFGPPGQPVPAPSANLGPSASPAIERQTCIL